MLDFVILERGDDVGGVWRRISYPGAGVDTPSYLYSFSFFRWDWSTHFAKRDEMAAYTAAVADHFDLRRDMVFGAEVTGARYDEAAQRWTVSIRDRTYTAEAVISAVGLFSTPKLPDIPGIDTFDGPIFHTAEWPDDLDLAGKRVAVVGTGRAPCRWCPRSRTGSATSRSSSAHHSGPRPTRSTSSRSATTSTG